MTVGGRKRPPGPPQGTPRPGRRARGGKVSESGVAGLHLHPSGRPHTGWRRGRCWGWPRMTSCPPWPRHCSCCWPSPWCRGVLRSAGAWGRRARRRARQGGGRGSREAAAACRARLPRHVNKPAADRTCQGLAGAGKDFSPYRGSSRPDLGDTP